MDKDHFVGVDKMVEKLRAYLCADFSRVDLYSV